MQNNAFVDELKYRKLISFGNAKNNMKKTETFIHFRSPALPADQQWPLPGAEEG